MIDASRLTHVTNAITAWQQSWGAYEPHPSLQVAPERLAEALDTYLTRLQGNYPFFHPRYAGQMLKPPHPVAVLGYLGAMLINPNNHALDGGPPTGQMEKEVVKALAQMVHFPDDTLGHLTSGGTVANLEGLWVARHVHLDKKLGFTDAAHYTHGRMAEVIGMDTARLAVDADGRMDVAALEQRLKEGDIGTIVVTGGTTGFGTVDPIADIVPVCRSAGVRVHVDAAYGGFYAILAWDDTARLGEETKRHYRAVAKCDSIAIDPHKHGLQPYGCGSILFRDPSAGRFYQHDSPYTYFTSDELHLGEISLECSRAGAAAGALWLTLQVFPLDMTGLGAVLQAGIDAAQQWADLLRESAHFDLFMPPELDIVTYFPAMASASASAIDQRSQSLFHEAMHTDDEPVFLSVLRVETERLQRLVPDLAIDQPQARILRSVLMKPEHETYVPMLHRRLETLAQTLA
ncbi:MAG: aminotransferase class V-fold PLP-dependent enzyme [Rhodothermales bacterium]